MKIPQMNKFIGTSVPLTTTEATSSISTSSILPDTTKTIDTNLIFKCNFDKRNEFNEYCGESEISNELNLGVVQTLRIGSEYGANLVTDMTSISKKKKISK